jgi:hypothetical protein
MSTTDPPPAKEAPPRRRPWLRWLGVLLLVIVGSAALGLALSGRQDQAGVERAVDELNATDPGWRIEDIEAARADVPERENSAPLIVAAKARLPGSWPLQDEVFAAVVKLRPCERLPEALSARLEAEMPDSGGPALAASQALAARPRGRHRLVYHRVAIETRLPDQQDSRAVCGLWRLEAIRLAEKGDGDGGLAAARAALNAGRSIGDEPFAISQLIRIACTVTGAQSAEHVLGLSEPGAAELRRLQELAEDEARHPGYRIAMRGERASIYSTYQAVASGEVPFHKLAESGGQGWGVRAMDWYGRRMSRADFPRTLSLYTRAVAITEGAPEGQAAQEQALLAEVKALPHSAIFTRLMFPGVLKLGEAFRRQRATMHALAAALAAERYRREHKAWPADLKKLVPDYLAAVPADPFDGRPLRYRLERGGAVVYSVGPDATDNGGHFCEGTVKEGCDIGLRLWNVEKRRQPAPAPPPEGGPGDDNP